MSAGPATDLRRIQPADLERLRRTVIAHFAEHMHHRVGMRAICEDARVSSKTVYKYFGSKEALLLACIEPDLRALTERAEALATAASTPTEALFALGAAQFMFYAEHPAVARIVFLNLPAAYWLEQVSPAQTAFQALLERTLRAAVEEGSLRLPPGASWDLARDIVNGAAYRIIVRWLLDGSRADLVALGATFATVIARVRAAGPSDGGT